MASQQYSTNVFINCPFDKKFEKIFNAIVFAVIDCGFLPRCAKEVDDAGQVRIDKIFRIISECKFGVHDISRTQPDPKNKLPRFNMPLELGIFLGARRFGQKEQKNKVTLIVDKEPYRFQKFISDLSGQDIHAHKDDPQKAVKLIRDWLNNASRRTTIPGGKTIWNRYQIFQEQLPLLCEKAHIGVSELTFKDYIYFIQEWLSENA